MLADLQPTKQRTGTTRQRTCVMPEYQTPQPISVVLELRVAEVRVAAGDREDTVVEVRPSDGSKRDDVNAAEQTRVEYADGRLLVKTPRRLREWSPFSDGGSIDVQIGLPAGSELIGHAAVGAFRCTGTLGSCELQEQRRRDPARPRSGGQAGHRWRHPGRAGDRERRAHHRHGRGARRRRSTARP